MEEGKQWGRQAAHGQVTDRDYGHRSSLPPCVCSLQGPALAHASLKPCLPDSSESIGPGACATHTRMVEAGAPHGGGGMRPVGCMRGPVRARGREQRAPGGHLQAAHNTGDAAQGAVMWLLWCMSSCANPTAAPRTPCEAAPPPHARTYHDARNSFALSHASAPPHPPMPRDMKQDPTL